MSYVCSMLGSSTQLIALTSLVLEFKDMLMQLYFVGVQALVLQGDILRFLIVALLIVFVVLESTHKLVRQHSRPEFIASAVIAAICSALLFAQTIYLLHVLQQVRKLQKHWYMCLTGSSCC